MNINELKKIAIPLVGGASLFALGVVYAVALGAHIDRTYCAPVADPVPTLADEPLTGWKGLRKYLQYLKEKKETEDKILHPLIEQRQSLGGEDLTRKQKIHFYALAMAEVGPYGTQKDFAMFMETPYNRGITEGDDNVNENLTRAYYEPLRKYRTVKKKYFKTVGKGKKKKRVKRYRKIRVVTSGWKNYTRYKSWVSKRDKWFNKLDAAHELVLAGSNYSNLGTQNGSAGIARMARKTQTITAQTTTGDTISRKDRPKYAKMHGYLTIKRTKQWVNKTKEALKRYERYELASNQ